MPYMVMDVPEGDANQGLEDGLNMHLANGWKLSHVVPQYKNFENIWAGPFFVLYKGDESKPGEVWGY